MRKIFLASVLCLLGSTVALALPPIPKHILEALADQPDFEVYAKNLAESQAKCASCHIPGADKKKKGHALNDFGQAMHKTLDDKAFMAAEEAKDSKEAQRLFVEAWNKAIETKNADGKTYAELLKAGLLPGKNE